MLFEVLGKARVDVNDIWQLLKTEDHRHCLWLSFCWQITKKIFLRSCQTFNYNTFWYEDKNCLIVHSSNTEIIYQSRLGSDRIQPYLVEERSAVYLDCLVTLSLTDSLIYFLPGMLTDQKWSFVINYFLLTYYWAK